jgi:hypothetical protein
MLCGYRSSPLSRSPLPVCLSLLFPAENFQKSWKRFHMTGKHGLAATVSTENCPHLLSASLPRGGIARAVGRAADV